MKTAMEMLNEKWRGATSTENFSIALTAMKEFAKIKCKEQRQKVGNELVTWTEDLSIPNQRKIHDLCQGADEPEM